MTDPASARSDVSDTNSAMHYVVRGAAMALVLAIVVGGTHVSRNVVQEKHINQFQLAVVFLHTFDVMTDTTFFLIALKSKSFEESYEGSAEALQTVCLTSIVFSVCVWVARVVVMQFFGVGASGFSGNILPDEDAKAARIKEIKYERLAAAVSMVVEDVPMLVVQSIYLDAVGLSLGAETWDDVLVIVSPIVTVASLLYTFFVGFPDTVAMDDEAGYPGALFEITEAGSEEVVGQYKLQKVNADTTFYVKIDERGQKVKEGRDPIEIFTDKEGHGISCGPKLFYVNSHSRANWRRKTVRGNSTATPGGLQNPPKAAPRKSTLNSKHPHRFASSEYIDRHGQRKASIPLWGWQCEFGKAPAPKFKLFNKLNLAKHQQKKARKALQQSTRVLEEFAIDLAINQIIREIYAHGFQGLEPSVAASKVDKMLKAPEFHFRAAADLEGGHASDVDPDEIARAQHVVLLSTSRASAGNVHARGTNTPREDAERVALHSKASRASAEDGFGFEDDPTAGYLTTEPHARTGKGKHPSSGAQELLEQRGTGTNDYLAAFTQGEYVEVEVVNGSVLLPPLLPERNYNLSTIASTTDHYNLDTIASTVSDQQDESVSSDDEDEWTATFEDTLTMPKKAKSAFGFELN